MWTGSWPSWKASVPWMPKTTYEQELSRRGELIYVTQGTSMLPFIRSGEDLVVITAKEKCPVKLYDAVLYRRDSGQYVLHRVVKIKDGEYWLRGDNRRYTERGIRDRHILGVLTAVIRNGRPMDAQSQAYRDEIRRHCAIYPLRYVTLLMKRNG